MIYLILILFVMHFWYTYASTLYLDKYEIKITPTFTGDTINLYGIQGEEGFIVIVFKGEKATYYIQKKEKKWGVWVKGEKRKFTDVYRYYNILSEHSLDVINAHHLLKPFEIGVDNINTYNTTVADTLEAFEYKDALFHDKIRNNLYTENYNANLMTPEKLLYTKFHIPENIPEGKYTITAYIINENEIKKTINIPVHIYQDGLLKFITHAVKNQKFLYLFLSIGSSISIALTSYAILGKKYLVLFEKIKDIPAKIRSKKDIPETDAKTKKKRGRPKKSESLS